ncbi:MAG TPA: hypothetical protein VI796_02695, partial [Candidatus Thermoplasmatota archaeon]|nr:hypothetical protein [Candidatus Thermoplasmatota archaeon]
EARVAVDEEGTYVAYALAGNVLLGADRAPADFEMHPLQVVEDTYPHTRPGGAPSNTNYGQATEEVSPPGVPYALRAGTTTGGFTAFPTEVSCTEDGLLRLTQGNETIGLQWSEADPWPVAALYLDGGPLAVWHDGFGFDGCPHRALTLSFYVAPTG